VLTASLLIEARRRAGLSQRELALRLGKRQAEIARWERGHVLPSLERVREIVAACGLELTCGLATADDSYEQPILASLPLAASARLARSLAAADRARCARALATGAPAPAPLDVTGVLRSLKAAHVAYVLTGEIAEVLHGSPLMPTAGMITIVPRAGERAHLDRALAAMHGRSVTEPSSVTIDVPGCWQLAGHGVELVIAPAPAGSHGFEDLRRDATVIGIDEGVDVLVASTIDLVRLAEASREVHDQARVPALRRTLELTTMNAAGDAAAA
jgi:transcriptional regulator with XRE-family HTH domain